MPFRRIIIVLAVVSLVLVSLGPLVPKAYAWKVLSYETCRGYDPTTYACIDPTSQFTTHDEVVTIHAEFDFGDIATSVKFNSISEWRDPSGRVFQRESIVWSGGDPNWISNRNLVIAGSSVPIPPGNWTVTYILDGGPFGNNLHAFTCSFTIRSAGIATTTSGRMQGQEVLKPASYSYPAAWDSLGVFRPWVISTAGSFMMWYSGESGGTYSIGLATSEDGLIWTKSNHNPVLRSGASGQWDSGSVEWASVIFENNTFKMWYTGLVRSPINQTFVSYSIGYATSSNGVNWVKYPGNPVLTAGSPGSWDDKYVWRPSVISTGSSYVMYYTGTTTYKTQNGMAVSTDGIHWTKQGPITIPPSSNLWDLSAQVETGVTKVGDTYLLCYSGKPGASSTYQIGVASSNDGISWTPFPGNPVLVRGSTGAWDHGVFDAMILPVSAGYRVYYSGLGGSIGLATFPTSEFPMPQSTSTSSQSIQLTVTSSSISSLGPTMSTTTESKTVESGLALTTEQLYESIAAAFAVGFIVVLALLLMTRKKLRGRRSR